MKKIRVTEALIERADHLISTKGFLYHNEILSRAELRALFKKGVVKRALKKMADGSLRWLYMSIKSYEELVEEKIKQQEIERIIREKPTPKKKLNIFRLIFNAIKKLLRKMKCKFIMKEGSKKQGSDLPREKEKE